jgi:hypothetical protein
MYVERESGVTFALAQTHIWGLTKGMVLFNTFLQVKNIPCLVQQNIGLVLLEIFFFSKTQLHSRFSAKQLF